MRLVVEGTEREPVSRFIGAPGSADRDDVHAF